jgi:ankyrin repeat protein
MPTRRLPSDPSVEHLKNQAKDLRRRARDADPEAVALVGEFHPRPPEPGSLKLSDAHLVIARMYEFPSWPALRRHVETIGHYARSPHREPIAEPIGGEAGRIDEFLRLACLAYGGDSFERWERARELLAEHPELSSASIHTIAATGDVAAARKTLGRDPSLARRPGGPHVWEPLLYLTYSRLNLDRPGFSTLEVARLLLNAGADPNAGFLWEGLSPPFTALTGAFGGGEDATHEPPHQYAMELARLLLEAGADPNDMQTLYNRNFLPGTEHLELLFRHGLGTGDGGPWHRRLAPVHPTPKEMLEEELHFAVDGDSADRVELLISHGVDVNAPPRHPLFHGRSAYETALASGGTRTAELLVAAGATVPLLDAVDKLLAALIRADRDAVERALAPQPELAAQAAARDPARIIRAVEHRRADAVRLMVDVGFDINHIERTGVLHMAAFNGDRALVDTLLELGADPALKDENFDAYPSGWAQHNEHPELAAYLRTLEPPGPE